MPIMSRPATKTRSPGAKDCTAAPSANSAPASSIVRLRPIASPRLPAMSDPTSAPKVTQLVTTWRMTLKENDAMMPGSAPEITPWS